MKELKSAIEQYFSKSSKDVKSIEKIGSGLVADAFKVTFIENNKSKVVVCRQLHGNGMSRDYLADNLGYLLLQHEISGKHPQHIKSLDIVCYGKTINSESINGIENVFQVLEYAEGKSYLSLLLEMPVSGLSEAQKEIILNLNTYMIKVHSIKCNLENSQNLYLRHSQDFIGSEVLMDILDVWNRPDLISIDQKASLVSELYRLREGSFAGHKRCALIHSDLHPDNIRIQNNYSVKVMDAARTIWGEPTDDLCSMLANFIYFAVKEGGSFKGVYKEAYELMISDYLIRSGDDIDEINYLCRIYLPIRLLILSHPLFFPSDSDKIKKKLIKFALSIPNDAAFDLRTISI